MKDRTSDYVAAGGWSSKLFFDHFKYVKKNLPKEIEFKVGRTVAHFVKESKTDKNFFKTIKAHVHYGITKRNTLTFTGKDGEVLKQFENTSKPEEILEFIKSQFA